MAFSFHPDQGVPAMRQPVSAGKSPHVAEQGIQKERIYLRQEGSPWWMV
jgi:hypothetical protein